MAGTPEAPVAPEAKSETNQPTTNSEPAQAPEQKNEAPDMHGFTSEQLAEMKKFYDANGGFDKVKSRLSNPEPKLTEKPADAPQSVPERPVESPQVQPVQYNTPKDAVTQEKLFVKQYFKDVASNEEFAPIADKVANGDYLETMDKLGIQWRNVDGSINDNTVREFLGIMAKTVPAQPTNAEPNASVAPTVDYVAVGDKIESLEQAQAVFMQKGHPKRQEAIDFLTARLNPNSAATQNNK